MTAASSSPRPDHQRVVVTGLGAITNLGRDVPTIWSALQSGKSGIDTIQCFDQAESVWSCKVAGEVRDWTPAPVVDDKAARRMDRYCQLAMWAAEEAVQDSVSTSPLEIPTATVSWSAQASVESQPSSRALRSCTSLVREGSVRSLCRV